MSRWSIPVTFTNARMMSFTNSEPLSDCKILGGPIRQNIFHNLRATVAADWSFSGRSTTKPVNTSITTSNAT